MMTPLTLQPIGVVRSPFREKREAPRQGIVAEAAVGTIELLPGLGYEHALRDLDGWDRLWVLFWFHEAKHFAPTVLPPRSTKKRGLFATRSPHRPNPIGLSAVKLLGVEHLTIRIAELDILDGTPVLDIKPYVPYADAFPTAGTGWLAEEGANFASGAASGAGTPLTSTERPVDPRASWKVQFAPKATEQIAFLGSQGIAVAEAVVTALTLGPAPHPYRRIRIKDGVSELSSKDWRFPFSVDEAARTLTVLSVQSGYRPVELFGPKARPELHVHAAFVSRFA